MWNKEGLSDFGNIVIYNSDFCLVCDREDDDVGFSDSSTVCFSDEDFLVDSDSFSIISSPIVFMSDTSNDDLCDGGYGEGVSRCCGSTINDGSSDED